MLLEGNWQISLYTQGSLLSSHRSNEEYMIGNEEILSSGHRIVSWGRGGMIPSDTFLALLKGVDVIMCMWHTTINYLH